MQNKRKDIVNWIDKGGIRKDSFPSNTGCGGKWKMLVAYSSQRREPTKELPTVGNKPWLWTFSFAPVLVREPTSSSFYFIFASNFYFPFLSQAWTLKLDSDWIDQYESNPSTSFFSYPIRRITGETITLFPCLNRRFFFSAIQYSIRILNSIFHFHEASR